MFIVNILDWLFSFFPPDSSLLDINLFQPNMNIHILHCSVYICYGADKENLVNNQLKLAQS